MTGLKDRTAIVGIGQTRFARRLAETELQLACIAIKAALDDAGIDPGAVDAMASFTQEATPEFEIARNLGFGPVHFFSQVAHGGGAVCGAVGQVAMAIAAGIARVGIVWRSRKRGDPSKRQWAGVAPRIDDHWKWSRPHGLLRPVDEVAVLTRRYLHVHGLDRRALAGVALRQRAYANRNPDALMADRPLSMADYEQARMISDPLCLFDNCLESDGAIAIVITGAAQARDLRHPPVLIHAFSQGMAPQHQLMADFHGPDPLVSSSRVTAANLWRQADMGPAGIDMAQLYDAFSPLVLFSLENLGFCGRGEASSFLESGRMPVNTSGGSLSEVYLHGANLVTEAVRQLRGTAANQIAGARTGLVSTCDSTPNGALILRRS